MLSPIFRNDPGRRERGTRLADWQIERVTQFVTQNLSSRLTVNELAGILRISSGHFSRSLHRTLGHPPHRFVLVKRVERAKQLMQFKEWSLAEIASECGLADQSHLVRVFSRFVGVTPHVWRVQQGRAQIQPNQRRALGRERRLQAGSLAVSRAG
jgi:AraC family transcriptional regulator